MALKALVTGATGCIGANVVAALLGHGYKVRALRRAYSSLAALDGLTAEIVCGDVLDPPSLEAAMEGCALVFHVAAASDYWRTPAERIYQVNVAGTRNVVDAALRTGVERLVYTSSSSALGVPVGSTPLDETATFNLRPDQFPYGHSKHLAEQAVQKAIEARLDAVIVNPTAVMGARDVHWIGGSLLRAAKRGLTLVAPPGGLNWVDAQSVGEGHVLAAERGHTGRRYLLGGENLSHRRALEIVASVVGRRGPILTLPTGMMGAIGWAADRLGRLWPGPAPFSGQQARMSALELYYDCRRAQEELGFTSVPFRTAVEQAYAWYVEHGYL